VAAGAAACEAVAAVCDAAFDALLGFTTADAAAANDSAGAVTAKATVDDYSVAAAVAATFGIAIATSASALPAGTGDLG
jgi:hypothetical protein